MYIFLYSRYIYIIYIDTANIDAGVIYPNYFDVHSQLMYIYIIKRIHIRRHLSLSFSDEGPAPDVPGGADAERLALFLESG